MTAAVPPDDLAGMVPMPRRGQQMKGGMRARSGSAMASAIAMSLGGGDPLEEGRAQPWPEQLPEHVMPWTQQEEGLLARGLLLYGRYALAPIYVFHWT